MYFMMGKTCFVPNCKSGYKSCKDKVSMFKPPKDADQLGKWRKAISRVDRILGVNDCVCGKHFAPHMIINEWTSEYQGNIIMQVQRGRPKLEEGAVPTIFPNCPAYLSKPVKEPRKRKDRCNNSITTEELLPAKKSNTEHDKMTPNEECSPSEVTILEAEQDSFSFNFFWNHCAEVHLPAASWGVHAVEMGNKQSVVFSEVAYNKDKHPINKKLVCFDESDLCGPRFFVLDQAVDFDEPVYEKSISLPQQASDVLKTFHERRICSGGPAGKEYPSIHPECASVDKLGFWRHRHCSLLLEGTRYKCRFCSSLHDTLRIHAKRRKVRTTCSRIRLPRNPSKKYKLVKVQFDPSVRL